MNSSETVSATLLPRAGAPLSRAMRNEQLVSHVRGIPASNSYRSKTFRKSCVSGANLEFRPNFRSGGLPSGCCQPLPVV